VQLWESIAGELPHSYTYVSYPDLKSLLQAVETGEVDLSINPTTVTPERMERLRFSQPFFISEIVVAKRESEDGLQFIRNIFSWPFFSALLALTGIISIFGFLVWLFEKGRNADFRKGLKGIGDGFWWSAVTMTTVGYGDKTPRTWGGRFIAFIWMFVAIVVVSSLTAAIASSLTVRTLNNRVQELRDLRKKEVGTIENSSSARFLEEANIAYSGFSRVEEGLSEVANGHLDFFLFDKPIIEHYLLSDSLQKKLEVMDHTFQTDYYSFTFPRNSPLFEQVDLLMVARLKSTAGANELP